LSVELASSAIVLQPSDLLLHVLDLRLHAPDFVRDLLRALVVARLFRLLQRPLELMQLLLEPRQFLAKLRDLAAVAIVWRPLTRIAGPCCLSAAGRLPTASRLSLSRPCARLTCDIDRQGTHDYQRTECCDDPSHFILRDY